MDNKVTLGGDRLGTGNKMQVELKDYQKSTHDLSYVWRSSMAAGTLVPFLTEVALPGDTFDINLNTEVLTQPTLGPLFESYKVQLDIFQIPIRLYNAALHNNPLNVGLNMTDILLPTLTLTAKKISATETAQTISNSQINPSSLLSYLNIRGIGYVSPSYPGSSNLS